MKLRLLGPTGLRVSELCLGTMTFGTDWGWGADRQTSQTIFETYAAAGGNFIDTSNNYTNGSAERFVGEFIKENRDRFVVATKFTLRAAPDDRLNANLGGNSRKSMLRSVENSLKRLETDYIDLLYLHMWDFTTPVEEVLKTANDLAASGKVLYFGFSDTPSWVVSYAIAVADRYGWPRPLGIQLPYSLLDRSAERSEIPMARHHRLAVLPWGMLEGGVLTGKYSHPGDEPRREKEASERERAAGEAVARIASSIGRTPAQVAINFVRQQPGNIIPILGCRSQAQIIDNLGCLDFRLEPEHMTELEQVSPFSIGFPLSFLQSQHVRGLIFGDTWKNLDGIS